MIIAGKELDKLLHTYSSATVDMIYAGLDIIRAELIREFFSEVQIDHQEDIAKDLHIISRSTPSTIERQYILNWLPQETLSLLLGGPADGKRYYKTHNSMEIRVSQKSSLILRADELAEPQGIKVEVVTYKMVAWDTSGREWIMIPKDKT